MKKKQFEQYIVNLIKHVPQKPSNLDLDMMVLTTFTIDPQDVPLIRQRLKEDRDYGDDRVLFGFYSKFVYNIFSQQPKKKGYFKLPTFDQYSTYLMAIKHTSTKNPKPPKYDGSSPNTLAA